MKNNCDEMYGGIIDAAKNLNLVDNSEMFFALRNALRSSKHKTVTLEIESDFYGKWRPIVNVVPEISYEKFWKVPTPPNLPSNIPLFAEFIGDEGPWKGEAWKQVKEFVTDELRKWQDRFNLAAAVFEDPETHNFDVESL